MYVSIYAFFFFFFTRMKNYARFSNDQCSSVCGKTCTFRELSVVSKHYMIISFVLYMFIVTYAFDWALKPIIYLIYLPVHTRFDDLGPFSRLVSCGAMEFKIKVFHDRYVYIDN